jgi:hypothetical protein
MPSVDVKSRLKILGNWASRTNGPGIAELTALTHWSQRSVSLHSHCVPTATIDQRCPRRNLREINVNATGPSPAISIALLSSRR